MAMNLRLREDAEAALRAEAERSGRSQQAVLRTALDLYLDRAGRTDATSEQARLAREGLVRPPRRPYRRTTPRIVLPPGTTSLDLLDRDDRV